MSSEIRIIVLIVVVLGLAAWLIQKSWAAEGIHGGAHLTAPLAVQTALVRAAAGTQVQSGL